MAGLNQSVGEALSWASSVLLNESQIARNESELLRQSILRSEAEMLLQWAAGWSRTDMLCRLSSSVEEGTLHRFREGVSKRANGIPLQYVTGTAAFYGRDFRVEEGCLIPRPETEWLVESAKQWVFEHNPQAVVVDVGTGSGAIAVTLALECQQTQIHAIDVSEAALQIASKNAKLFEANVTFHAGDGIKILAGWKGAAGESAVVRRARSEDAEAESAEAGEVAVDGAERENGTRARAAMNVLVSNPPYIPSKDVTELEDEVKEFEPRLALDGGEDGLDFYRSLVLLGEDIFAPGPAALFLEVGAGQAEAVAALFKHSLHWSAWEFWIVRDLRGIERIVAGNRLNPD